LRSNRKGRKSFELRVLDNNVIDVLEDGLNLLAGSLLPALLYIYMKNENLEGPYDPRILIDACGLCSEVGGRGCR
jgi:hypothetical protein